MCVMQGVIPLRPKQALKRLVDTNGLYPILANTIMEFIKVKPQPFGMRALLSREDFWNVQVFKRALTFVFLMRYILGYQSQRMWKRFKMSDYKFNTRCFKRWSDKEGEIFKSCDRYNDLPETAPVVTRKRQASAASSSSTASPFKRHFVVNDESTSDSE